MSPAFNLFAIIIRGAQFIIGIIVLAMAVVIETNYQDHGFSFSYADLALATSVVGITMAVVVPMLIWSDVESVLVAIVATFLDFCTLALWIATMVTMAIFYGAHDCDYVQMSIWGRLPRNLCRIGRLVIGFAAAQVGLAIVAVIMGIIASFFVARSTSDEAKVEGDTTIEMI